MLFLNEEATVTFSLMVTDLKNEDGYEISIPFEDSNLDESGFYQHGQAFDGKYLCFGIFELIY